jgi:hypothetical protein
MVNRLTPDLKKAGILVETHDSVSAAAKLKPLLDRIDPAVYADHLISDIEQSPAETAQVYGSVSPDVVGGSCADVSPRS